MERPSFDTLPRMEDLEDRRVYAIRSRNLLVGVWHADSGGFLGIRTKFSSEYLFMEYHWDYSTHIGTVRQATPLDVVVPDDVPLVATLPGPDGRRGAWCSAHDVLVEWKPDEPGGRIGKWFHLSDDTELAQDDWPQAKENKALFDLLKPLHDNRLFDLLKPLHDNRLEEA